MKIVDLIFLSVNFEKRYAKQNGFKIKDALEENLYEQIFSMDMDLAHKTQMLHFVELVCDVSDIIENIAEKIQIVLITKKV